MFQLAAVRAVSYWRSSIRANPRWQIQRKQLTDIQLQPIDYRLKPDDGTKKPWGRGEGGRPDDNLAASTLDSYERQSSMNPSDRPPIDRNQLQLN